MRPVFVIDISPILYHITRPYMQRIALYLIGGKTIGGGELCGTFNDHISVLLNKWPIPLFVYIYYNVYYKLIK